MRRGWDLLGGVAGQVLVRAFDQEKGTRIRFLFRENEPDPFSTFENHDVGAVAVLVFATEAGVEFEPEGGVS